MRAFVLTGPGEFEVREIDRPVATPDQVVVDVERAGVCGTDHEFFTGEMAYLRDRQAAFPIRLGHEWSGTVASVGADVDPAWLGRRVTGDTMLGCGSCLRCVQGHQHVCEFRFEVGIRGGFPGALAEQLAVPVSSLHVLPDAVDAAAGALVEPGGSAYRCVRAAALEPGQRLVVLGAGTIGLLVSLFARARGIEVLVVERGQRQRAFAVSLGLPSVPSVPDLYAGPVDAVVDASTAADLPAAAVELVEPSGRVVYVGLSSGPSLVDSRRLVLKDVTAIGVLSGSPGLTGTIELYASGAVDPRPLVAATVGLESVGEVLAGHRPAKAGAGPKIQVDPRL